MVIVLNLKFFFNSKVTFVRNAWKKSTFSLIYLDYENVVFIFLDILICSEIEAKWNINLKIIFIIFYHGKTKCHILSELLQPILADRVLHRYL